MIQRNRANVKSYKRSYLWLKLVALGVGVYLALSWGRGLLEIRQAGKRLEEAQKGLEQAQTDHKGLLARWDLVRTSEFQEQVARNDLNMQKEGETVVVVMNKNEPDKTMKQVQNEAGTTPNWLKWWELLK